MVYKDFVKDMQKHATTLKKLGDKHGSSQAKFCHNLIFDFLEAPSKGIFAYKRDVERNTDSILNEIDVPKVCFLHTLAILKSTIEYHQHNSNLFTRVEKLVLIACEQIVNQYSRGFLRVSVVDALVAELNYLVPFYVQTPSLN